MPELGGYTKVNAGCIIAELPVAIQCYTASVRVETCSCTARGRAVPATIHTARGHSAFTSVTLFIVAWDLELNHAF